MRIRTWLVPLLALSPRLSLAADPPLEAGEQVQNPAPSAAEGAQRSPPSAAEADADDATRRVYIVGQVADRLQRIPGSVTVVSPKEVRRMRPADTGELLRSVPGVNIRSEEGLGLRLNIGLRGLNPTRSLLVQVLEDGSPIALNPYGEPDLYYSTPVDRVHAVQVVKGSGSLLFGPRVIGGVVNFITLPVPSRRHWVAEVEAGQRDYLRALARYGDTFGDAGYVLQAVHRQGDGFRSVGFRTDDFLAKVAFQTSERSQATLKLALYDETSESPYLGLTEPMAHADPRQDNPAYHDQFDVRRYDLGLHHRVDFDPTTVLETRVYAYETKRAWRRQDYDRERDPSRSYEREVGDTSLPGGAVFFRNSGTIRDRTYDVVGIEPRLEHSFFTGSVQHAAVVGMRLHLETGRARQYATDFPTSDAGSVSTDERMRTLALATYLQDRIALREDVLVTPGVRVEHGESRREVLRSKQDGTSADVAVKGDSPFTAVLPGVGVVVGTPQAHAFSGVHLGFAPPRVSQAVTSGGVSTKLDPEKSVQLETGTRLRPVRWAGAEATVFYTKFYNQILLDTPAGGAQSELVNGGETRHHGLELAADSDLGKFFALGASLVARASYTYTRASYLGGPFSGNRLPYSPLHQAGASLDLELPAGPFARGAWTYVGEQFTDEQNNASPSDARGLDGSIDGYHLLDFVLGYHHAPTGLRASVIVKNPLDEIYIASRLPDGIQPAGFRQVTAALRWEQ
jgi:Fe(3+) dicitrate transport protein